MLVKSTLYGDVSEKPMMGMSYPFFAGTFVEILCHRFFSFGEDE
jgi:hypothetical protein